MRYAWIWGVHLDIATTPIKFGVWSSAFRGSAALHPGPRKRGGPNGISVKLRRRIRSLGANPGSGEAVESEGLAWLHFSRPYLLNEFHGAPFV